MIYNFRKSKIQNNLVFNQATKLQSMEKRIKKLSVRLWAVMFLLFIVLAGGAVTFVNFYQKQLALALSSNYGKTSGDMLTANIWNNLPNDFVAKSGDTMSGDLTVNGNITGAKICDTNGCIASEIKVDYSDCTIVNIGEPIGPHTRYCPTDYVVVGGNTDGNDYVWEDVVCCKLYI